MKLGKRLLLIFLLLFVGSMLYAQTTTYWRYQDAPHDLGTVRTIAVHPNNTIFVGNLRGSIYYSQDNGVIFSQSFLGNTDTIAKLNGISVNSLTHIFAAFDSTGIYKSTNNGQTWSQVQSHINATTIFSSSSGYVFAGTDSGEIYRTPNSGDSWALIGSTNYHVTSIVENNNTLYCGTIGGGIFRSSDLGNTWVQIVTTSLQILNVQALHINNNEIYAATSDNGMYKSSDLGTSWVQINDSISPLHYDITSIVSGLNNDIFIGTRGGGVYMSTNFGTNWIPVTSGLSESELDVYSLAVDNMGFLYAGTKTKIYRSTFPATLDIPKLVSPNNNRDSVSASPFMVWNKVANADFYYFEISTDPKFKTSYQKTCLKDTFLLISGLAYETEYYWRVQAFSISGVSNWSVPWKFKTAIASPDIPTLLCPINDTIISSSPVFEWEASPMAAKYHFQLSTTKDFSTLVIENSEIVNTNYSVGPLEFGTKYYWRVRATNIGWMSDWSKIDSFISPVFEWEASPRAAKYHFQLSTTKDFSTTIFSDTTDYKEIVDTSYSYGPLEFGTKYYWRVRATNIGWMSDWSKIDSFMTNIPKPDFPNLISPAYAEKNVALGSPLVWSKVKFVTKYNLQVSTDSLFDSYFFNDYTSEEDTIQYIGTMDTNTIYYWRVKSYNIVDSSDFSPVSYFTTIPNHPTAPTLIYPADADIDISPSPTFIWNNSDYGYGNSYQLQVSESPSFSYVINNGTWISDTTEKVFSLQNSKQYYWRVRAKNIVGVSDWSPTRIFTTSAVKGVPPWWSYVSNTGNNSSISIPIQPTIDNIPISNGDAIGVFYLRNDSLICGGYTIWDRTINNGVTIWGDNAQTIIKDGFAQNEFIYFRIWDGQEGKEYPALAKLAGGKTNYFMDEYLALDTLRAATKLLHTINLNAGWNLISTYADPHVPNIDTVFKGIRNSMVLLKDGFGQFYWPDYDIYQISNFEFKKGYQIYMLEPATLTFKGSNVIWDSTKINLVTGWNMISYLRYSPMRIDSALSSILGKVILVKNGAGEFFWNEFGINSIGSMKPGVGYQIYMSGSDIFHYPNSVVSVNILAKKGLSNLIEPAKPQYFVMKNLSSINTAILLFESNRLKNGDEVAIFNSKGYIVGSASAIGNRAFMTIFGYDEIEKNIESGAKQNENLYIKVFDKDTKKEYIVEDILVTDMINNKTLDNLYYKTDALLKVTDLSVKVSIPDKYSLEQNYPNPFNPTTIIKFSLASNSQVSLEIYNTLGQVVKKLINGSELNAGTHQIEFNAEGLSTGIYFYKLQTESYSETKKMMFLK